MYKKECCKIPDHHGKLFSTPLFCKSSNDCNCISHCWRDNQNLIEEMFDSVCNAVSEIVAFLKGTSFIDNVVR